MGNRLTRFAAHGAALLGLATAAPLAVPGEALAATAATAEAPVLQIWTRSSSQGRKTYDAVGAAFTQQTGIRVEFFNAITDFEQRLARAAVGGQLPDVVINEIGNAGQLVNMGVAAEIDRSKLAGADNISPAAWRHATLPDGKIYGVPTSVQTHVLFIRKDWRQRLGLPLPQTWEDLAQLSRAFTEMDPDGNGRRDTYGLAFPGTASRGYAAAYLSSFLFQAGASFVRTRPDGHVKAALDESAALTTLSLFHRLVCVDKSVQPNAVNAPTQETNKAFMSGQAGIYLSGPYHIALFDQQPGADRYEVVAAPAGPGGVRAALAGGELAYITRASRQPALAIRFIEFLISERGQTLGMRAPPGGLPVVRLPVNTRIDAAAVHADPRWKLVADEYRLHGRAMPVARNWSRLQQIAAEGFNTMLSRCSTTLAADLKQLNTRLDAELARQEER